MILPTSSEVHLEIIRLHNQLSDADEAIGIFTVGENLHISTNELIRHINTLIDLNYLRYADIKKEKIRLTYNGRSTLIPDGN
jgi:RIO-like serine/threonine protein kinase